MSFVSFSLDVIFIIFAVCVYQFTYAFITTIRTMPATLFYKKSSNALIGRLTLEEAILRSTCIGCSQF